MATTLAVFDETMTATAGDSLPVLVLDFLTERITVRELIRSRVYQEVKDYNVRQGDLFRGLVQPSATEQTLNGYRFKQPRKIDWEEQFELALKAFDRNGFVVLVDDRQAESLEDEIVIQPGTKVSFLKLVPLVGG